jgi:hypothetical protein
MKLAFLWIGGAVLVVILAFWLLTRIRYRVGRREVKVLLWGIPLRRIPLADITYASKHPPERMAERWYNTLKTSHRLLTIEKRKGLFKNVCISPKNRYEFLGELKSAVRKLNPDADWAQVTTFEESATIISESNKPPTPGSLNTPC